MEGCDGCSILLFPLDSSFNLFLTPPKTTNRMKEKRLSLQSQRLISFLSKNNLSFPGRKIQ